MLSRYHPLTMDEDDPYYWKHTSIPEVHQLDAQLRCLICKDYFKAPVMTSCSHTFCSRCIRRHISLEQSCPACRQRESESSLRRNPVVEELVQSFFQLRPRLLDLVRDTPSALPQKGFESEATPPTPQAFPCPICDDSFPESEINNHVNACLTNPSKRKKQKVINLDHPAFDTKITAPQPPPSRLPKINYSLINETNLRQKLLEAGLPSHGSKLILQRRYSEWINIYNANTDAAKPRGRRELMHDLDAWERGNNANNNGGSNAEINLDRWGDKHQADFASLTAQARQSKRAATTSTPPPAV